MDTDGGKKKNEEEEEEVEVGLVVLSVVQQLLPSVESISDCIMLGRQGPAQ